tara:strand:+ start:4347 stop:5330 length:984 start_codon:yes stop_codon:yes gene_type:complete
MKNKTILVTGAAGFIANNLVFKLLGKVNNIVCIDNFNNYYDISLKHKRHLRLVNEAKRLNLDGNSFSFHTLDLRSKLDLEKLFSKFKFDGVCHLAAQAGVRYSIEKPQSYVDNNITATLNLLEVCKDKEVQDIIFASTSSVYGLSEKELFDETLNIDSTISTYSSTKRACELLCHNYSHLFGLRFRILRFFTVYGPWGRPDMALFKFAKNILENKAIDVYNNGKMVRDFTYIDDIVDGFISAINLDKSFEIINLGCGEPVKLMEFINLIENELGKEAKKNFLPLQPGDVPATMADISKAQRLLNYKPSVTVAEGIPNFIDWYKSFYI